MIDVRRTWRAALAALVVALAAAAPASADRDPDGDGVQAPKLDWTACTGAAGFECATADVPRDYARPRGATVTLALVRRPAQDTANRIGSLFVNFGGPGGPVVDTIQGSADAFAALNQRYDIVGFDPRGVGHSVPSIDCKANAETQGIYRQPFPTPENVDVGRLVDLNQDYVRRCVDLNKSILPYVSTANVARDMDLLRQAVGDEKLSYFGYSYGTFLGATYASLFPNRFRAMVLDGPLDADAYVNHPLETLREQSAGFERALNRFLQACAADQVNCLGFGGADPLSAFDELADSLDAVPMPARGSDPRPVDGDDLRAAAFIAMYNKQFWPLLAQVLALAKDGDGTGIRVLADAFYARNDDGTYDPVTDRYFTIGAIEQQYPRDVQTFLDAGRHSWKLFDHAWFNSGYAELPYGLYPIEPRGVYLGPFSIPKGASTPLVVATRYDPATPYPGARQLVRELGNAQLLTMIGDGHTAYPGNSACVDQAVEAYLNSGALPSAGTVCRQEVPFAQPQDAAVSGSGARAMARRLLGFRGRTAFAGAG